MKNCIPVLFAFFFFNSLLFSQTIQWQQLNGPFGGTALSFASNSNGDLFAGADQDQRGIFRSIDGGLTFQPKSAGLYLDNRAFNWLVVDDSSYIIAGTDSHIGSKVYKSKDNGESWTEISILSGTSVVVNDSGHIYVGNTAYAQYSVSKDGGYTWTHFPSPAAFTNCITINDSGHIFIGGNYTGYRSTDNGINWTSLGSAGLPDAINSIAVAPNGNLFAGCSRENASNSGVYRSTDNGDSWAAVKQGFRVYASHNIVINNNGDIIVGTYGWGIWKSTDNGDTWTQYNSGLGHLYVKAMHITNNGNVYAGLIGGGIYRSTDNGENWAQVGICAALIKKISINPVNENLFAAVYGVSRSTDGGLNWQPANNGLTNFNVNTFAIKTDGTVFIGCAGGGYNPPPNIFRSIDNGGTWVPANTGISQGVHIPSMTVDADGNIYAGTSHDGVYKSTDNGDSWSNIGNPNAGHLLVNSNNDLFIAGNGIWKLSVNDTDWVQVSTASNMYSFFCGSNDYLYAANLRSTDNGETWTEMGLNVWFTSSFAENSLGHLFCGTFNYGSGVWRSTDFGETWTQINIGLPTMDIRSVAVDSDDYLYAGTNGYSMYKTTTSTVIHFDNPSLIAFYPFDGNADDFSGYDNHGNVMGAILTTDRFGNDNSAYEFDGSSNYISIPNSFSLQSPTNELTQLAWVNIYSWTGQGFWVPVLMKSNSGDNAFQYRLSIGSNGVNTSINNWNNGVVTPDSINFNQWYMITSVLKNDTVKHYVNEKFIGSGTLTGPINLDTKPLEIGRDTPGGVEYYHGKIDDIRIYNRALTATEIDSIYDLVVGVPSEDKTNIPMTFRLNQNYPNPFNPSTRISWQSPVNSEVTLKVFAVLGNEITTLVDEYKPAGKYEVEFNAAELPSGVYFYRLQAGDYTSVRKMILLK